VGGRDNYQFVLDISLSLFLINYNSIPPPPPPFFSLLFLKHTMSNSIDRMNDPLVVAKIFFLFSPLFLMTYMLGSAIMAGTPLVFLFYFFFVLVAWGFRHLLWMIVKTDILNPATKCGKSVFLPGKYNEFVTTFMFAFTIAYVFGPLFSWYQATESSVYMFIGLIIYAVYDLVFRIYLTKCMDQYTWGNMWLIGKNVLFGGILGAASQAAMKHLGLSKYLYYSSNANRPTKKVFKCGKVKST
jgi:hypothetical protein